MAGEELGEYYTIPVILSMAGVEKQANNLTTKALGNAGAKGGKEFTAGFIDAARKSESQVKRLSQNYEKLYDKAADAADKLKVAQTGVQELTEKGITSGQRYERAVAAQNKAQRDHTRALKVSEDALKDYEKAAKGAAKAGDKIADSASSGLRGVSGQAVDAGEDAAGGFYQGFAGATVLTRLGSAGGPVGLALAGLGAVGVGVGKILGDNIAIGMQQVATLDLFQARLGVDEPSMARYGKAAADAYTNAFGESIEGNLTTLQFAVQGGIIDADATEREAARVIEQIETIRAVSEADAREITRAMNQLVRTGLADSTTEAADILVTGFQQGLDVSDDFLDSITEYSTQFRELGLSATDVLGLLKQGLEGGARDTDKVADALKEFAIRAQDGSETTANAFKSLGLDAKKTMATFAEGGAPAREAFDEVLDRVREIPDAYDRGLVAAALFGTQWEDLQDAFNNFDLDRAKDTIGDFTGSSDKAMETAADNAATEWEKAGRHIEDVFRDLRMKIADWFSWVPGYFNSLFEPSGILSDDPPPINDPATTGPVILPPTTGPSGPPTSVPELAPGLSIPGVTIDGQDAPFTIGGPSGGVGGVGPGGRPTPGSNKLSDLLLPPLNTGSGGSGGSSAVAPRKVGSDSGLLPQTVSVKDSISTAFADINDIGGFRQDPSFPNEHPSGKAIDVMIPNWSTPQGKAYGDKIAAYALQQSGVDYVLWQQRQWNRDGSSSPMPNRGDPTQNHMDHVHVHVEPGSGSGQHPQGSKPVVKTDGTTTLPLSMGRGPVSPDVHNAFGTGYEPGIGTPGYNEYGEPGYYETDPRRIRQAERSAEDSQRRIGEADEAISDIEAQIAEAQAERDRIAGMSEVERTMNKVSVEKADADLERLRDQRDKAVLAAERAREDAQWAQEDLAETRKGTFSPAREARKDKRKERDRDSRLGELGKIGGSFLKETLGIGDWLPDLAELWPVQAFDAIMSAGVPMLEAFANGEWKPGGLLGNAMGIPPEQQGVQDGTATSNAPFGMPNIAAPPMPPPGVHEGSGTPGPPPGTNITIDQSVHGNVGSSPEELFKNRDEGLSRAIPRIPVGS